ncbi:MAG TPA: EAL domain-containing protein [Candidatus Polarisedimenticolia bacterium]|jgi:EAL domain-containing protein (putative c-di-GMP-specific phosphodiesterase class I)|nr:EAL domain-containing protein [Candidatus Polarisedimenticolia bacterium]
MNQISPAGLEGAWVRRELTSAFETNALSLVYQPKIDLKSRSLAGVEALIRWSHPQHGPISPADFIPLAEESDVIDDLTVWVADHALAQARIWSDQGFGGSMALNVSARNLNKVQFPDMLAEICARHSLAPDCVIVEITETASQQILKLLDTLTRLRLKGFCLALDDFGIGFSSMAQLQQLPFSEIKVDRSFVGKMAEAEDCLIITRAIINLGHELGLKVVAEGVESAEALEKLVQLGCDTAQGYHIGRPMSAAGIQALLKGTAMFSGNLNATAGAA